MKVAVLTASFGDRRFIGACIDQFKGFPITRHLVLSSVYPWNGQEKPDDTPLIAARHGADVMVKGWRDENEQRLEGISLLKDNDFILFVDSDEFYTTKAIHSIFDNLKNDSPDISFYIAWRMYNYWKDWDHIINPFDYPPAITIRPETKLINIRDFEGQGKQMSKQVCLHHLSYTRNDTEIKRKIASWGHASEVANTWYKDKWLKWNKNTTDFHPTKPDAWKSVRRHKLPREIRQRIIEARKDL